MSVPAVAQRRHLYGNHAEAIIEVLPEPASRKSPFELLVRSGNDADIHIRSSVLPIGGPLPSGGLDRASPAWSGSYFRSRPWKSDAAVGGLKRPWRFC